jgi:GNAT superfamily N-acetyltransferase
MEPVERGELEAFRGLYAVAAPALGARTAELGDVLFADWLRPLARRPGWHCFVAYDGETPAGAGALYVARDVGWIGIGATVPQQRGKGAQSALLAARIAAAAGAGCGLVVTETQEPVDGRPNGSHRNILRAGFEPRYVRANYVPATTDS